MYVERCLLKLTIAYFADKKNSKETKEQIDRVIIQVFWQLEWTESKQSAYR